MRTGVTRCPLFMVLYLCHVCQCGLHNSSTSFCIRSSNCVTDLSVDFQPTWPTALWKFLSLFLSEKAWPQKVWNITRWLTLWPEIFETGSPTSHGTQTQVSNMACMLQRPERYHLRHRVVLWSHIGILILLLAAEPRSTTGPLFHSQCPFGTILLALYSMGVGLAGFKSMTQCFFISLNSSISFCFCFSISLLSVNRLVLWAWGL